MIVSIVADPNRGFGWSEICIFCIMLTHAFSALFHDYNFVSRANLYAALLDDVRDYKHAVSRPKLTRAPH